MEDDPQQRHPTHGGEMFDVITPIMSNLPLLSKKRSPNLACLIGFLTGGIGLGFYFRSFVDALLPLAILGAFAKELGPFGWVGGAVLAALYGCFRAQTSNVRREAAEAAH
jgi:hypothetical protein